MRKKTITLALVLVLMGLETVHAENKRDPFNLPASAESHYQYDKAIQEVIVHGIVQTETASHVIIYILDSKGLAVLKTGETFALNYKGVQHVFRVGKIGIKSVWFHPRSPSTEDEGLETFAGKGFEVFIR